MGWNLPQDAYNYCLRGLCLLDAAYGPVKMNKSSSRWIEPRVIGPCSSNPIPSSTSLNKTSNVNTKLMNDRVLYPKIAPRTARSSSISSDLCLQSSRDTSAEALLEAPIAEGNDGKGHRRVQRQSHTKSRTGCFNCKRRRIKVRRRRKTSGKLLICYSV